MKSLFLDQNNTVINITDGDCAALGCDCYCVDDSLAVTKFDIYNPDTGIVTPRYIPKSYEYWDDTSETWIIDIDKLKSFRCNEVNKLLVTKSSATFEYTYATTAYSFESDIQSNNSTALAFKCVYASNSIRDSTSYPWTGSCTIWNDIDDAPVTFTTAEDFVQFATEFLTRHEDYVRVQTTHKTNIRALSDAQDILDYDITQNW